MDLAYYATLDAAQRSHWWYAARRTILSAVLEELHGRGLPPGAMYDLGCGVGANLPVLERFGEVIGVDASPEAVDFARARGFTRARVADLSRLEGLEPGSARVALLADVIEHLDDEAPCLEATARLLAPGGALVITVPAFMFLWGPSDEVAHHRRRYTEAHLRAVVGRHFEIERTSYFNTLLFPLVAAGRVVERVLNRPGDETARVPPEPVNRALQGIFSAEARLVPRMRLPVGVSLLCVARKR